MLSLPGVIQRIKPRPNTHRFLRLDCLFRGMMWSVPSPNAVRSITPKELLCVDLVGRCMKLKIYAGFLVPVQRYMPRLTMRIYLILLKRLWHLAVMPLLEDIPLIYWPVSAEFLPLSYVPGRTRCFRLWMRASIQLTGSARNGSYLRCIRPLSTHQRMG